MQIELQDPIGKIVYANAVNGFTAAEVKCRRGFVLHSQATAVECLQSWYVVQNSAIIEIVNLWESHKKVES